MAFHITQCPCCNSTFSISARLLNAANGKVRCGSCLSVFLAEQQLVDSEPATDDSENNNSVFVGHAPEDYFDPASFLTREAPQQQPTNNRIATSERGLARKTEAELRSTSALSQSSASPDSDDDRGPAEDIAAESGSEKGRAEAIKTSVTPAEQTNKARSQRDLPDKLPPGRKNALTPEKLERIDTAATSFSDAVTEQNADAQKSSGAIRARALKMKFKDDQALEQLATENLASLQYVATPVELHSDSPTRWGGTLTLLLTASLLGMSIVGQHLWRNQEHYSQQVRWRPLLEWVCANRGCDLPLYEDLPAIEPSDLFVRSHPNRADAIMVQVQIRNTAPFEQAFPVMIVGFNTADNDLIALREFSPAEYLQGELPESATMPVMAPVPINLALMDPGEDAVNYTLAFRRP